MNCEVAMGLLGKYFSRSNGVRHSHSFAHQPAALHLYRRSRCKVGANLFLLASAD
jgi:predicted Zn-dependent protease with MMP-like domain